jgi:hypothetical protein
MSDVTAAFWVAPDLNTFITLPPNDDWLLVDVIIVTGGTDTTQSYVFANNKNTGTVIDHKSNLNTANFRQFFSNPIGFKGGSMVRFQQIT